MVFNEYNHKCGIKSAYYPEKTCYYNIEGKTNKFCDYNLPIL